MMQMFGALMRALLLAWLVAAPALMLTGAVGPVAALMATVAALFALCEYGGSTPSLIEFRDAPPFNRIRFLALAALLIGGAAILQDGPRPTLALLLDWAMTQVGHATDGPGMPLSMALARLDPTATGARADLLALGGLGQVVALCALAGFALALRGDRWPGRRRVFNLFVNLPMFEPTMGGDLVSRLRRDAAFNLSLGVALPYLLPALVGGAAPAMGIDLTAATSQAWVMAAWSFLPTCLVMRAMALRRVAAMVAAQRAAGGEGGGTQPA
ncbi:MAG: hypothetical protein ACU0BF_08130 [Paracoccaceae bacterium]